MTIEPIGYFHCSKLDNYDAAHQPNLDDAHQLGYIELKKGFQFDYALEDLDSFSHIWILFLFDRNSSWKPKVQPPRGSQNKRGVFATRSPYRPNFIGMSCVKLEKIEGLKVWVSGFDLLDQTSIIDIKPYLPQSDIIPDANMGWLEGLPEFKIEFSSESTEELAKTDSELSKKLKFFIETQLKFDPTSSKQKRIRVLDKDKALYELAYKLHRVQYSIEDQNIVIQKVIITE